MRLLPAVAKNRGHDDHGDKFAWLPKQQIARPRVLLFHDRPRVMDNTRECDFSLIVFRNK